jgi:hypothetical protein
VSDDGFFFFRVFRVVRGENSSLCLCVSVVKLFDHVMIQLSYDHFSPNPFNQPVELRGLSIQAAR